MIMQVGLEVFLLRNRSYLLSFYPLIAYWMPSFSLYHTTSCLSFPKNSHNIDGHCDFWTPCSSKMKEYKNRECNSCEEHWNHLTTLHNSQNNPAVFFLQDITSVLILLQYVDNEMWLSIKEFKRKIIKLLLNHYYHHHFNFHQIDLMCCPL